MSNERHLLLFSSRADDQAFAAEVARVSVTKLTVVASAAEAARLIDELQPAAIFVDCPGEPQYKAFEAAVHEKVGLYSDKISANAVHFLSNLNLESVPYLIQSPLFGNFVLRNYQNPTLAGAHYGKIVRASLSEKAFGLAALLDPNARIQTVSLTLSTQKQEVVEAIKNYAIAAKFQSRMATVISNAVDELIMNAIFDAPVDSLGRPTFVSTSRNSVLKLENKSAVEIQVGFDGQHLGVTAIDHFGSLEKLKLLSHISKLYTEEEYRIKQSVAGAGIGLATVFRSGGSFFFASESRVRTEVTVLFQNAENYREFRDQFRFISTQFYF